MRAAGCSLLDNGAGSVIDEVYGTTTHPSPWAWTGATPEGLCSRVRTRLAMNPETGTALKRGLVFSEELWADGATFEVTPLLRLPDAERERHELVLLASAHAVHGLGSDRRRGFGWVSIAAVEPLLDEATLGRLGQLVGVAGL